jgi:hypothetical protein
MAAPDSWCIMAHSGGLQGCAEATLGLPPITNMIAARKASRVDQLRSDVSFASKMARLHRERKASSSGDGRRPIPREGAHKRLTA